MKTYTFRVVIEPEDDQWIAYSPVLERHGASTWGATQQEALDNIREVLQMTLESMLEHGEPIPEEAGEVHVSVDPQVSVTI